MRLVAISDTHCKHKKVSIPDGDILICSGDFTGVGRVREIADFNTWLGKLPHSIKICCSGNHDFLFETDCSLAKNLLSNAVYLQNEMYETGGLKFWGSPVTPTFLNWAFMLNRGPDILCHWKKVPEGIDVLITHGPPFSVLDTIYPNSEDYLGCEDMYDQIVNRIKPRVHIFGHIHGCGGRVENRHGIKFCNASICDEEYNPTHKPIIIEID